MPGTKTYIKVGDEVDLHLDSDGSYVGRYRILSSRVKSSGTILYSAELQDKHTLAWYAGHEFSGDDFSWDIVKSKPATTPTPSAPSEVGCVCKTCNSRNKWAEPNKPNGVYICYECR